MRRLAGAGVDVTVVTNSLASTDVPAVHAGYVPYRRELLEAGVQIYEVRPSPQREGLLRWLPIGKQL